MFSSRASEERDLTASLPLQSSVTTYAPAAESGSQAILFIRDARWIVAAVILYTALVAFTVLTLHPYFSQTWDVVTFVNAGKSALSPAWNALYEQSRADRYWPYAYPPLHAFAVAPFVELGGIIPGWLFVRLPPLLFDIALGILLYEIVAQKTRQQTLARLALVVWLLNPVTWYDTAVQGHFEAEWLFFVALAYWLAESRRGWILPTLALAVAFLFKQNALLFALPYWAQLFFAHPEQSLARRALAALQSIVVYAVPVALVSLPFVLHSNDYWFMNVQYVTDVPLQTQSWLVALAGMFSPDHFILRASSLLTLFAAAVISFFGVRRGMDLWLGGFLIVLAFFLLSKKVVGYYYVMILPFALVTLIPVKRFRLLSLLVAATAFISLSPYFASWTNQAHWWLYAILGVANSVLWLGILVWLWREHPLAIAFAQNARAPAFVSLALFFSAAAAALLQPLINSQTSPIRAPLVPEGAEQQTLFVFLGFAVSVGIALVCANLCSRTIARTLPLSWATYALVVLLAPLYFLTFTLTKESTAALEFVLGQIGM